MYHKTVGWTLFVVASALFISMLSLHRPSDAAPPGARPPFANAVEQRGDMVEQLREITALLKEQNTLLRTIASQGSQVKPDVQNPRN